jgi:hypothetical protein
VGVGLWNDYRIIVLNGFCLFGVYLGGWVIGGVGYWGDKIDLLCVNNYHSIL